MTPLDDEGGDPWEENWQISRKWAARHQHVVFWLLVAVTFAVELFCLAGVAESGMPFAAVLALPFAFLPLAFFWLAIDRTKRVMQLRRLIVGKWRAERADGVWQIQFTTDGKLLLNDALTADYALYANLDLGISSEQVRDVLEERVVILEEDELVVVVNGSVCRFSRAV